ncbi:MAG: nicotinate-nucleotide adenylyltransferase [Thermodesulfobacteriota bacterium]|nr:nicotinate-nucleotide adenylyltransferase [Thermodesulfobacteriota bacterium]
MRYGLFGGTFNPVHKGHLQVILDVKEKFSMDRIFLIPCASPPHKTDTDLAPADMRLKMVKSAVKGYPGLEPSDIEIQRQGKSYTIDTIREFQQSHDTHARFFLIMGSDAFFDIQTWKKNYEIFSRIPVIVMLRADHEKGSKEKESKAFPAFVTQEISDKYTYNFQNNVFFHPVMQPIYLCRVPQVNISSTRIRYLIKENQSVTSLLPGAVEDIIRQKGLYL